MARPLIASLFGVIMAFGVRAEEIPAVLTPSDEEQIAIREAEAIGSRIFAHDMAATVATDALMNVRGFKRNRKVQGWITEERGEAVRVTFIGGKKGDPLAALYRVMVSPDGRVEGEALALKPPEHLSAFEAAAAKARSLAASSAFEPCSKKYNSVVLPQGEDLTKWIVYMLPGTTNKSIVPLGGSYRFDVNVESESFRSRPYTKTCIQLDSPPEAVALMTSHLLDPVPTEVHVFWSIWSKKPMYIVTIENGSMWSIEGAKVNLKKRRIDG